MVGSPHNGFNLGPASPMHFIGNWGIKDDDVPPVANLADDGSFDPNRASEPEGCFYATSEFVTQTWASILNCSEKVEFELGIHKHPSYCWKYSGGEGGSEVVGCNFTKMEHDCNKQFQREPMLDFMIAHPKPFATY